MRAALGIAAVLLFAAAARAAGPAADSHADGPASAAVANSAFLHGYLHGYEDGFHDGNIDLQIGRTPDPSRYARKDHGYRKTFGDRDLYEQGFSRGFLAAYFDAYQDRSFRGIGSLRDLGGEVSAAAGPGAEKILGDAMVDGYASGLRQGLDDGRRGTAFRDVAACSGSPSFCSGFAGGFRLGYSDGYANQHRGPLPSAAIASK